MELIGIDTVLLISIFHMSMKKMACVRVSCDKYVKSKDIFQSELEFSSKIQIISPCNGKSNEENEKVPQVDAEYG